MAGRYQEYPEYKKSGIVWLGSVPTHWKVTTLKYEGLLTPPKSELSFSQLRQEATFVPMEKLKTGKLDTSETRAVSEVVNGYTYFRENDVLLAKVTPCFENKNVAVARNLKNNLGFGSSEIYVFRPKNLITSAFWFYRFQESEFMALAIGAMTGAGGLKRVPSDFIESFKIAVPESEEQSNIVNFLDHETAKIDALIEKQEKLIELLKEKRQAVISYAVTKGLNPDVSMKDSGIEWLGEVPQHWIVKRLKHCSTLQSGIAKGKDLGDKESISVPMLRVANVQDGYLNLNDVHEINIEPAQLNRYRLIDGDVLMNEGGDNDKLGRGTVWYGEIDNCIHQNHVFAIRPIEIESEWLELVTRASYARFHFYRVSKQSTNLASISSSNIRETPLVLPPKKERLEILQWRKEKDDKFHRLIQDCSAQIALLKERRTSLISAAVTGKIDVRHWQSAIKEETYA